MSNAVVVPGHGVPMDDGSGNWKWVGIYRGEGPLLAEHIKAGVDLAVSQDAVLVFTGGVTRKEAGQLSEAEGYENLARYNGWLPRPNLRVLREDYARDSLENNTFVLARIKDEFGRYPSMVTVVGWEFKEERFVLHAATLRAWLLAKGLPCPTWVYVGVNNPRGWAKREALAGEELKLVAVKQDLLLLGKQWKEQRAERTQSSRKHSYSAVGPELPDLDALSSTPAVLVGPSPTIELPAAK